MKKSSCNNNKSNAISGRKGLGLISSCYSSMRASLLVACAAVTLLYYPIAAQSAEPSSTDREFIEMQTSINALMVAVVDWAAHEVWEAGYANTMTGQNWLTVKQYATELLVSGTLISLGGTGSVDQAWVRTAAWQEWSASMIDETREVLGAIQAQDQQRLQAAGDRLISICEGCHAIFKPEIPTEGIMHIPHNEFGDPLSIQ